MIKVLVSIKHYSTDLLLIFLQIVREDLVKRSDETRERSITYEKCHHQGYLEYFLCCNERCLLKMNHVSDLQTWRKEKNGTDVSFPILQGLLRMKPRVGLTKS